MVSKLTKLLQLFNDKIVGTGFYSITHTIQDFGQIESRENKDQDYILISIANTTDQTSGMYSCEYNYLDIPHNARLDYSVSNIICNKNSCNKLYNGLSRCYRKYRTSTNDYV